MAQPTIQGTWPKDGDTAVFRTAFIAIGYSLPDTVKEIDPWSLTDSSIFVFPTLQPDTRIQGFLDHNDDFRSITFEPFKALAPLTSYTLVVTGKLKDGSGNSFTPFQTSFTTGSDSLKKHITLNRSRSYRDLAFPGLPRDRNRRVVTRDQPLVASDHVADVDKLIAATSSDGTAYPEEEAEVTLPDSLQNPEQPAPATTTDPSLPVNSGDTIRVAESPTPPADSVPAPITQPDVSVPDTVEVEKELIAFPKDVFNRGGKLPVGTILRTQTELKYLIKKPDGTTVRKGIIRPAAGKNTTYISLIKLPPGRYRISIKWGEEIEHQVFTILK
ncbi:Ig-like domain-containing protein [Pontibacter sp. G13]|uniref:Ig-like domain-containing protein n=1 Tax=Pontibacter sp. G13 TaxID=3074898 RepID=UPI00288A362C|nr:Ig-like domain-containing protein [Pontibacter sp. G13]WNJ16216.1 Ig-like domain-containing protein [Pontibacter sp. G13]